MYFLQRRSHWNRADRVNTESESESGSTLVRVGVLKHWRKYTYLSSEDTPRWWSLQLYAFLDDVDNRRCLLDEDFFLQVCFKSDPFFNEREITLMFDDDGNASNCLPWM